MYFVFVLKMYLRKLAFFFYFSIFCNKVFEWLHLRHSMNFLKIWINFTKICRQNSLLGHICHLYSNSLCWVCKMLSLSTIVLRCISMTVVSLTCNAFSIQNDAFVAQQNEMKENARHVMLKAIALIYGWTKISNVFLKSHSTEMPHSNLLTNSYISIRNRQAFIYTVWFILFLQIKC